MIFLLGLLLICCILLLSINIVRSAPTYWLILILLGWFMSMLGITLYMSKYGGFYYDVNRVVFFTESIRQALLFSPISIDMITRFIVIGRSLFMVSVVGFSLSIDRMNRYRLEKLLFIIICGFAVINAVFYEPVVYKKLIYVLSYETLNVISYVTRIIVILSLLAGISYFFIKLRRITMPWIKRQIRYVFLGILVLVVSYFFFGIIGPLQVTNTPTNFVLYSDYSYSNPPFSVFNWIFFICSTSGAMMIFIIYMWRYNRIERQIKDRDIHLERKMRSATNGATVFSHAVKNRLVEVRVLNSRIQDSVEPEYGNSAVINGYADEMDTLIQDLIDHIEGLTRSLRKLQLNFEDVDVVNLTGQIESRFERQADPGMLTIRYDPNRESLAGLYCIVDRKHFIEAMMNIFLNATEAVVPEKGRITFSILKEMGMLVLRISDNGKGIEKKILDRVFDPFFSAKNSHRNWGVGLSYTRRVVNGHYGTIEVESRVGEGSTFSVFLPVYKRRY